MKTTRRPWTNWCVCTRHYGHRNTIDYLKLPKKLGWNSSKFFKKQLGKIGKKKISKHRGLEGICAQNKLLSTWSVHSGMIISQLRDLISSRSLPYQSAKTRRGGYFFQITNFSTKDHKVYMETKKHGLFTEMKHRYQPY